MGIDVYMKWDEMTEAQEEAQFTGWDTTSGHLGYLREAYHGGPYATHVLFPESFDGDGLGGHRVAVGLMETLAGVADKVEPATVGPALGVTEGERTVVPHDEEMHFRYPAALLRERLPFACEAARQRATAIYNTSGDEVVASLTAFVELYERLEAEGKRPTVYVSY